MLAKIEYAHTCLAQFTSLAHQTRTNLLNTEIQPLLCHQVDELNPPGPKGGIIVCAEMGDVHLIRNLAHLLNQAAKGIALDSFRYRVNDSAKLSTIAVRDIGK